MKILFIGDIVGKPGRQLVRLALPIIVNHFKIDLVVANVENVAGGAGITREIGNTILKYGIDVMTSGNHIWDKKEAIDYIADEPRLLRPANYPAGVPGQGSYVTQTSLGETVAVINIMGRVFMSNIDNPFAVILDEIQSIQDRARLVLVDFHAEATSEKLAMGWHLDGKVTAVVGTHTHVQTADQQILPHGTAYITDVGMTGPHDSIIGVEKSGALTRFLNSMPSRFETATGNPRLHAVIVTADSNSGTATHIERLNLCPKDIDVLTTKQTSNQ